MKWDLMTDDIQNRQQTTDYGQQTSKNFILEKTDFYAILFNKLLESIVYTTPRTARRSKWTDLASSKEAGLVTGI